MPPSKLKSLTKLGWFCLNIISEANKRKVPIKLEWPVLIFGGWKLLYFFHCKMAFHLKIWENWEIKIVIKYLYQPEMFLNWDFFSSDNFTYLNFVPIENKAKMGYLKVFCKLDFHPLHSSSWSSSSISSCTWAHYPLQNEQFKRQIKLCTLCIHQTN